MSVAIQGTLAGCRTTVDGGWNLQFACGQDQVDQVAAVSGLREEALYIVVMSEMEYLSTQAGNKND